MVIGVNTRFLLTSKMEGFGWFTYETMQRIAANHPEHQFIFFFDRKFDPKFIQGLPNVEGVVLRPQARHPILHYIWFEFSITAALKKYKCDAFISPDGYCSLRTNTPQLAVIHDLNFEHNPGDLPKMDLYYYKGFFPKFAQKASRIVTVSKFSKTDIETLYNIPSSKIDVAYNGASSVFQPQTAATKTEIKDKYTEGAPFLLFVGALNKRKNLSRLVEAFEKVKNRLQLPHKLLIVGEQMFRNQSLKISKQIAQEVRFTGHLSQDDLSKVTGSADLFCFVSYFEGFGIPMVEAMRSKTPVLAGNLTALPEIGERHVHYCDPLDVNDIADKIQELLTDEDLRNSKLEMAYEHSLTFNWDKTAEKIWESFSKMMSI